MLFLEAKVGDTAKTVKHAVLEHHHSQNVVVWLKTSTIPIAECVLKGKHFQTIMEKVHASLALDVPLDREKYCRADWKGTGFAVIARKDFIEMTTAMSVNDALLVVTTTETGLLKNAWSRRCPGIGNVVMPIVKNTCVLIQISYVGWQVLWLEEL